MQATPVSTHIRKINVAKAKVILSRTCTTISLLLQNNNFGIFRGYCLGDQTVQCCVDSPGSVYDQNNRLDNSDGSWRNPNIPDNGNSIVVPTIPTINSDREDNGAIVVPTIEEPTPQAPPTAPGGNWHKGGWANDIASTSGVDNLLGFENDGNDHGLEAQKWGEYSDENPFGSFTA